MLIKIDYREMKLIQYLTGIIKEDDKIKMVSENLPIGDIILCDDLGQEKAIIERKSLADLAASIRDGRYKEQGFRLNQCNLHNHQIYYLIEGDLRHYKPFKGSPDKKSLLSAMTSMSYFKGFSLYRTMNLEESAEWLLQFAVKLEKEKSRPFYLADTSVADTSLADTSLADTRATDAQVNYAEVVPNKRIKKDNITPVNIGEIMLVQIPSVSSTAAIAIMQKFSTFSALMNALQTDPHCLNSITTTNKNGQSRKLTKPCIQAIFDYLVKSPVININL
jgi:ERCC4-type nuclease